MDGTIADDLCQRAVAFRFFLHVSL
jgi:hypothetical protein